MSNYERKPNIACFQCGKRIYRRPGVLKLNKGKAYCSQRCYGKSCRQEIPCIMCGKLMLSGANKRTCGRACANKNRAGMKYVGRPLKDKVKSYKQLKDRLVKKRGIMCERCALDKVYILQVHHKDRNRNNNKTNNLELLCPNCHAEEHYFKK